MQHSDFSCIIKSGVDTDEEKLCLINEISESALLYSADEDTQASVVLPAKTLECYTFDVETGLFVAKDSVVGKDYQKVSEMLYRIYNGYSYDDILDEDVSVGDIPEDTEELGEKIYNSASTLCQDGYVFCYVTGDGIREDVVIPFNAITKLTQTTETE